MSQVQAAWPEQGGRSVLFGLVLFMMLGERRLNVCLCRVRLCVAGLLLLALCVTRADLVSMAELRGCSIPSKCRYNVMVSLLLERCDKLASSRQSSCKVRLISINQRS